MNYEKMSNTQLIEELRKRDRETPPAPKTGKYKFTMEIGVLVAAAVLSNIKTLAFDTGVELNIEEDTLILSKVFRITAFGEVSKLTNFQSSMMKYKRQLERA